MRRRNEDITIDGFKWGLLFELILLFERSICSDMDDVWDYEYNQYNIDIQGLFIPSVWFKLA